MIGYLWAVLGWRRITGADVNYAASGALGWLTVSPRRGRRPLMVELPREEWVKLAATIDSRGRDHGAPVRAGQRAGDARRPGPVRRCLARQCVSSTAWGRWRFNRGRGRSCRLCVLGWSLLDLLRHRHATGEFGHCHLRMSQRTFDATRNVGPAVRQRQPWEAKLDDLLGLSVVVDAKVPAGSWHLAENAKPHRIVRAGRVSD